MVKPDEERGEGRGDCTTDNFLLGDVGEPMRSQPLSFTAKDCVFLKRRLSKAAPWERCLESVVSR